MFERGLNAGRGALRRDARDGSSPTLLLYKMTRSAPENDGDRGKTRFRGQAGRRGTLS